MEQRLVSADILRIIGVYLIIVLHLSMPQASPSFGSIFFSSIVNISVPLLVMLSGALLLGKKETYQSFFYKRFLRIFLPWFFWSIIFTLIIGYYNHFPLGLLPGIFHSIFIPLFWFFPMILGLYALTPSLRIYLKHAGSRDIWLIIIFWFLAISLLPTLRDTQAFSYSRDNGILTLIVNYLGYFILGYALTKIKPTGNISFKFVLPLLLGFIINFAGTKLMIRNLGFLSPGNILITASIFYLIYGFEDKLKEINAGVKKIISTLSRATFGIFLIHFLIIGRAPLPLFFKNYALVKLGTPLDAFGNAVLVFLISFMIIYILRQIPIVRKFSA